ncbi:MAG: mechanosensitive ion channel [Candidatus Bipolaricaulota bacterium]|nr:MAG: mechanosensitive ion channel [Candidatus Bipolaricaulota bacterium]
MTVWDRIVEWVISYGGQVLGAIATLVIGYLVARIARRIVGRVLRRTEVAAAIRAFLERLVYVAVLVFAVVATLARFGVQTTSFVAVLGAVGFAVGFALQGALSNFAAGVLILVLRPFRIGDFIETAGVAGTVEEIQLFTTVLATPDNVKVIVPNGRIYGEVIRNFAGYDTRRLDLEIQIAYDAPIERAASIVGDLIAADPRILDEPKAEVLVADLADSGVRLSVRSWVLGGDYWAVRFDLLRATKEAFERERIEIPFPQRVVHMAQG